MLLAAYVGDKYRIRGPLVLIQALLIILGVAMMAWLKNGPARYVGVFLGVGAVNSNIPAILSYQHNNISKAPASWNSGVPDRRMQFPPHPFLKRHHVLRNPCSSWPTETSACNRDGYRRWRMWRDRCEQRLQTARCSGLRVGVPSSRRLTFHAHPPAM